MGLYGQVAFRLGSLVATTKFTVEVYRQSNAPHVNNVRLM
jgi:hypothetical protein